MGSYSPTILPAPRGFLGGLSAGVGPTLDAYTRGALKKRLDEQEKATKAKEQSENLAKFAAFAKENGQKLKYGYSSKGGLSASTLEEKDPTLADLQVGAAGALPASKYATIGKNMGIQPEMLPPEQNPNAMMSLANGGVGDINEQPVTPVQKDYGQTVMNALRKNPMVNRPGRQTTQLPSDFANDFKVAHDSAEGNPDKFVSSLKDLGLKYADNPVALTQVKRLIDMNAPKKKSGGLSRLR